MLEEIESQVKEKINVEKIKEELLDGLNHNLLENKALKKEFDEFLEGRSFTSEFAGISIMIFNSDGRQPYYLGRLHLYDAESTLIATYEIEYSADGEILDDFLIF